MALAGPLTIRLALCALAISSWTTASLRPSSAAVLPGLMETNAEMGGAGSLRAAVLADSDRRTLAGRWTGRLPGGQTVLLDRFERGLPVATARLSGLVPDGSHASVPLLAPTVSGNTMSFAVIAGCRNQRARGRLTVVPPKLAQLVLGGASPVSVQLSRVG